MHKMLNKKLKEVENKHYMPYNGGNLHEELHNRIIITNITII